MFSRLQTCTLALLRGFASERRTYINVTMMVAALVMLFCSPPIEQSKVLHWLGGVEQAYAQGNDSVADKVAELTAKINDPNLILLRGYEFNPRDADFDIQSLVDSNPRIAALANSLSVKSTQSQTASKNPLLLDSYSLRIGERVLHSALGAKHGIYIVQFAGRISAEWRAELRDVGAQIIGYIHNNAYLARMSPEGKRLAEGIPHVRWVGLYQPAFKIDPRLAEVASAGGNAKRIRLSVSSFKGARAEAVQEDILSLDPSAAILDVYENEITRSGRIILEVDVAVLPSFLVGVARFPAVEWVTQQREFTVRNDNSVWVVQSGDPVAKATPLHDHGLTGVGQIYGAADTGIDADACQMRFGSGSSEQTRFNTTQPPGVKITDPNNKIITYYLMNGADAYDDFFSGAHGTHTTGNAVGDNFATVATLADPGHDFGDGMAPGAQIVFQDIGDSFGGLSGLTTTQTGLHTQAYNSGVRVHNNSYGTSGAGGVYGPTAQQVDEIMWRLRDYTVFWSAGNDGPGLDTLSDTGEVAKNDISVGATDTRAVNPFSANRTEEDLAEFSSHGPTEDMRFKPDIMAPGITNSASETEFEANFLSRTDPPNNQCRTDFVPGTSFSSPTAAGIGLLVRQYFTDGYYPTGERTRNPLTDPLAADPSVVRGKPQHSAGNAFNPSNALIKAVIINSGRNMTGKFTASDGTGGAAEPFPNFGQGWGRMTLDDSLFFFDDQRKLLLLNDALNGATTADFPAITPAITTGETHEFTIRNVTAIEPLRITLNWSDKEGALGSGVTMINDLDLVVTDPDGVVYRGNVNFQDSYSQPAGSLPVDNRNTTENVYIKNPTPGDYRVQVVGANVPGDGTTTPFDSSRQGYALIATGDFTVTNKGFIGFDRDAYAPDGVAILTVKDADINNPNSIDSLVITATSDTEPDGQAITLVENAKNSGVFVGGVQLGLGLPVVDDILQVSAGDAITAAYHDDKDQNGQPATVVATATIDATAPVISNVNIATSGTRATISWTTNEPASSTVRFGTDIPPDSEVSDPALTLTHSVGLSNLFPNTLYILQVFSTDQAGNTAIDDNGGLFYVFRTTTAAAGNPITVFQDDMESGPGGWTTWNAPTYGDQWELGVPNWVFGPPSAYSGQNSWGTDLTGDYDDFGLDFIPDLVMYLDSPPIDLTTFFDAQLTFFDWLDIEDFIFDFGTIEVRRGSDSSVLAVLDSDYDSWHLFWQQETFDLSPFVGETVFIRFNVFVDASVSFAGWYIDDFAVTGTPLATGPGQGEPAGPFALAASPPTVVADGVSTSSITSAVIRDPAGAPVPDGTLATVSTDLGQIDPQQDIDPATPGVQVAANNGILSFSLQSATTAGTATVIARTLVGWGFGFTTVRFVPGAPDGAFSLLSNPKNIQANEISRITSAAIRDAFGNPVADGEPVVVSADPLLTILQNVPSFQQVIIEPFLGGDSLVNTTADPNDAQLIAPGAPAAPGKIVVGPGPDGVLQTAANGDDLIATQVFTGNGVIAFDAQGGADNGQAAIFVASVNGNASGVGAVTVLGKNLPSGDFPLSANPPPPLIAGGPLTTITNDTEIMADGAPVPDGTLLTVATSIGKIISPDADPSLAGLQMETLNGFVSFDLRPDDSGKAIITASSVLGDAQGSLNLDILPPAPVILTPQDGATVNNRRQTIRGMALPNAVVRVFDAGNSLGTIAVDNTGVFAFTPPSDLADGLHPFAATATAGGLTSPPSTVVNVTVDTAPPVAAITNPADGDFAFTTAIDVIGTANDALNAVLSVRISVSSPRITRTGIDATTNDNFQNWTASVPLDLGVNTITVEATDILGNANSNAAVVAVEMFGYLKSITSFPVSTGTGANPRPSALSISDLDGDGDSDIVISNVGNSTVSVLKNGGGANYGAPEVISVGVGPKAVVVADVAGSAGDGHPDIITANAFSNSISILLNNGAGGFPSPPLNIAINGVTPTAVLSGDFNADGFNDLAVANFDSNDVSILINDGIGQTINSNGFIFSQQIAVGAGPRAIAIGDVDNDGNDDLLTANQISNDVSVLINAGGGTGRFSVAQNFGVVASAVSVTAVDLNGDDFRDIAALSASNGAVAVFINDGTGRFGLPVEWPVDAASSVPSSLFAADLDGDADSDIAVCDSASDSVILLINDGAGGFGATQDYVLGQNGSAPAFVDGDDLNGNGHADLVTANSDSDNVSVLINNSPVAASIDPVTGDKNGGTPIGISGLNFFNKTPPAAVTIGGAPAVDVNVVSSVEIQATAPAGAGEADVVVLNPNGQRDTLVRGFGYEQTPAGALALTPNPAEIAADGVSLATITSDPIVDVNNNVVPSGTLITVATTLGNIPVTQDVDPAPGIQVRTDVTGIISFQLQSAPNLGQAQVSANAVEGTATGATTVDFVPGPPAGGAGGIVLTPNPAVVVADGVSESTVTSDPMTDAQGFTVADGVLVTVATTLGGITSPDEGADPGIQVSTVGGVITFAVASTIAGPATITAASLVGNATGLTQVNFVPGDPSGDIALTAVPPRIVIGGNNSDITSDPITDANGNVVPAGALVTVATDMGNITSADVDPGTDGIQVAADGGGQITFTLTSGAAPGVATATAESVTGDAMGNTAVEILASAPPIATIATVPPIAGPINEGDSVQFDGSASTDPDGDDANLSFKWDVDGDGFFDIIGSPNPIHTYTDDSGGGVFTVTLEVIDETGVSDTASLQIAVNNVDPVADAGGPYTTDEGTPVQLDATNSSDVSVEDVLTFEWDFDGDGQFDAVGPTQTFNSVRVANENVFNIALKVTDDDGGSDQAATTVTVINVAPTITSAPITSATEESSYTYDADAVDPGVNDALTFLLDVSPTGMSIDPASGLISWTPTNAQAAQTFDVTVRVEDDAAPPGVDTQSFQVNVANVNDPPSITSTPVTQATQDQLYQYDVEASDDDLSNPFIGDALTFSLDLFPSDMTINPASGLIKWTPTNGQAGMTHNVIVRVSDGEAEDKQSFTIDVTDTNDAPTAVIAGPPGPISEGDTVQFDASGSSDPDGDPLTYAWDLDNDGQFDDATGVNATYTFDDDTGGPFTVNVQATDSSQATGTASFVVNVINVNPVADTGGPYTASEGQNLALNPNVTDPGADTFTFEWDLDNNGSFETTGENAMFTNVLDGPAIPASHTIRLRVTDDDGGPSLVVQTTVTVVNVAPTAITGGPYTTPEGSPVTLNGGANEPSPIDAASLTFEWDLDNNGSFETPGQNVQFDQANVADESDHIVRLRVTDKDGGSDTASTTLTVQNVAPVFDSVPVLTATEDQPYTYDANAVDPGIQDTVMYSLFQFPAGMTIDPTAGVISWIPTVVTPGQMESVTVRAADNDGGATDQTYTIVITAINDAPVVGDIPNKTVPEDGSDNTIDLDDYVNDEETPKANITWTASGNVNIGVQIDPVTHVATLTPAPNFNGQETITFRATDDGAPQMFGADTSVVSVVPVNDDPTIIPAIADFALNAGASVQRNLSPSETDVEDNRGPNLRWSVVVPQGAPFTARVDIDNNGDDILTVTGDFDRGGANEMTLILTDSGNAFTEQQVNVVVAGPTVEIANFNNGDQLDPDNAPLIQLNVILADKPGVELSNTPAFVKGKDTVKIRAKKGAQAATPNRGAWRKIIRIARGNNDLIHLRGFGRSTQSGNPVTGTPILLQMTPPLLFSLAPENGAVIPEDQPTVFVWASNGIEKLSIQFMSTFGDKVFQAKLGNVDTTFTPTLAEWAKIVEKIRKTGAQGGTWHLAAREVGTRAPMESERRQFTIGPPQGGQIAAALNNGSVLNDSVQNDSVLFGDLDGDGDLDAVVSSAGPPLLLFLNNGRTFDGGSRNLRRSSVSFDQQSLNLQSPTINSVALDDADDDHDLDILLQVDGQTISLINDGSGEFQQ